MNLFYSNSPDSAALAFVTLWVMIIGWLAAYFLSQVWGKDD